MRDGVYVVQTRYFTAGFDIRDGKVTRCAPILRKRLAYWQTIAEWCGPPPEVTT